MEFDYNKLDYVELDGVDTSDYPDFTDATISYAEYDGRELTEYELDELNEDGDLVYQCVLDSLL